jgi:hypothetical protein
VGGGGLNGLIRRCGATANGLDGAALAHCDALLCPDELAWRNARDGIEAAKIMRAFREVQAFIELHGQSRFVRLDDSSDGKVINNRAGYWMLYDANGRVF